MPHVSSYRFPDLPVLEKQGLYDPQFEHSACGVGMVANIDGTQSHEIIRQGLEVLINLGHRGAAGADPETGDGAGLMLQLPHEFLSSEADALGFSLPEQGEYGVANVFLPMDAGVRAACETEIEGVVASEGLSFLGWRDVPTDPTAIGVLAARMQPFMRQFFVALDAPLPPGYSFEIKLFVLRRQIESAVPAMGLKETDEFYVCSLSSNRVVYKGLVKAEQLEDFYHDLSEPLLKSAFAIVHSRFGTNTLGTWRLAHPYRLVAHNGEINTLRGNINWMIAREPRLSSSILGDDVAKLRPLVSAGQSDTSTLDNVLELLLATGRSLPHAMMMLIPEAWADHIPMDQAKKDFYEYHSALMEPWDGPALVIGTDGKRVCGILDRNGLRPCRYLVTTDGLLVMASETGVLDIPPEKVLYKSRIQPGKMFMLDTEEARLVDDDEIKASLSAMRPYGQWLSENKVSMDELPEPAQLPSSDFETLAARHRAFGYTREDLGMIIGPMGATGKEPVGSMGNDAPLAIFSDQNPLLFGYFKQHFAQVSNPPLDAIREELVTSVETFLGAEGNLFDETAEQCRRLKLNEPVLTNTDLEKIKGLDLPGLRSKTLSILWKPGDGPGALERAMTALCDRASEAVKDGYSLIVLSDRDVDDEHAPIPSLLATAGVHHSLIREGTRTMVGLVVESGEPREVAHFALLFGYGAGAVNAYMAFETLEELATNGHDSGIMDYPTAESNFVKAIHKGVVKVMSKMGISTLASYHGAQIFEAVGLGQDLVDTYFTWTPSRIGGIGIAEIEQDCIRRHDSAYHDKRVAGSQEIAAGGQYQWRANSERHMWDPDAIAKMQHAVKSGDAASFKDFTDYVDSQSAGLCTIRGLLDLKDADEPVSLDEVESAKEIVKRFATGAISLGSIGREAHETLAIAMNRIGARSNTGEGGEDPTRYKPDSNGDSRNSAMKQVASGRFGVTSSYLASATDLQIKMAQGSKPGEGGQLPGHKVDEYIGSVRNSTPGVELISPPPHHDIYSIEDLAQLIHDLKNSNPEARIHVKLVSEAGVGTIAAGVSKGHADVVLISGDSGGTGASPESSIKHAGLPWELGVAETQQVLVMNDLRGRIVVQTDGQLKTGRDVAVACLLGAEEFGFATAPLISMGCIMLRKCHLNTCSVGIATQDPELRKKFAGKPEHVINYFFALADQLREIMAKMGFRTINEMVGRVDRLDARKAADHWQAKGLDLSGLTHIPNVPEGVATYCNEGQDHGLDKALDHKLIAESREALEARTPVRIDLPVTNANRTVGTMLSYEVSKRYGGEGLAEDTIQVHLNGSAGQSFASFLAAGISMYIEGDANDYFCKGLSGGKVVVAPQKTSTLVPEKNVIVGNVSLYGATGGSVFVNGVAGERFAVRNSGAEAVVEGVGDHGCEYMTRGRVVVLGPTGRNFAAGMSGGDAYVLDEDGKLTAQCNLEMVDLESVEAEEDISGLRRLLEDHVRYTGSATAKRVLDSWDTMLSRFVKVMPRDYKRALAERAAAANGSNLAEVSGNG
jgi:glutamate synthase (NADPH/NADH) large chain